VRPVTGVGLDGVVCLEPEAFTVRLVGGPESPSWPCCDRHGPLDPSAGRPGVGVPLPPGVGVGDGHLDARHQQRPRRSTG